MTILPVGMDRFPIWVCSSANRGKNQIGGHRITSSDVECDQLIPKFFGTQTAVCQERGVQFGNGLVNLGYGLHKFARFGDPRIGQEVQE